MKKFRTYLLGTEMTIRTDHDALTFLQTCRFLSGRLLRSTSASQEDNFNIQYI